MRKIIDLIRNNFYLRNISLVVSLMVILLIFIIVFLKIYTHHGQALSVPYLNGLSLPEAEQILEKRNLKYEVIDSVYITDQKGGVVIDQVPKPEFKVKKNRTVFLTVNAHTPEKVIMPNVVGYSYRQASAVLNTRGLTIGKLIYKPYISKNMVLGQKLDGKSIAEGDTVVKGSKIDLEIGNGLSNERVLVPDLVSLTIEEAKNKLNESYLNLGGEIPDNTIVNEEDRLFAFIFRQNPDNKKKIRVPMGSVVDIWITLDSTKLPGYDSVMNVIKLNEENLYEPSED